jgi:hypothetical protein
MKVWFPTVLRASSEHCVKAEAEAAGTVIGVSKKWIVDRLCIRACQSRGPIVADSPSSWRGSLMSAKKLHLKSFIC